MEHRQAPREPGPRATELTQHLEPLVSVGWANLVLTEPRASSSRTAHEHRRAYLSLTLSGGWRENYRGRTRECGPGALAVHLPEASHARQYMEPGTRQLYLEVEPGKLPERWSDRTETTRWSVAQPLMHALFASFACAHDNRLHVEALGAELILELFGPSSRTARPTRAWLHRVRDTLEDDLEQAPTLCSLSRHVGTHPSHLARNFRAAFGLSIGQYVQRLRVARALDALHLSERPLASIAAETGFSDQSHLGRVFKRQVGVSPAHYRRLLRG